jgi:pimeloyl-ACP methyl ester carboxylesterase
MTRAVILIHGYNVVNPQRTVGQLRQPFERLGYVVETFTYGYVPHTWQITKRNPSLAKQLAERVRYHRSLGREVDLVGHSNGCTIAHLAGRDHLTHGDVRVFTAINPALEIDLHPCSSAQRCHVWHNDGDGAVKASRWLRLVTWLTPLDEQLARPWGRMGAWGYTGDATNVINHDTIAEHNPTASGHSAVFEDPQSAYYMQRIAQVAAHG